MVKFQLAGEPQEYVLGFDFNALADAEALTGVNLLAAIADWPNLSCVQARALLYALLKPAHPEVLVKEAGGLFTKDMSESWRQLRAALIDAELLEVEKTKPPIVGEVASPAVALPDELAVEQKE